MIKIIYPVVIKLIVFVALTVGVPIETEDDNSLQLVHVVFRHGDRTPPENVYPLDPYLNESYYPFGRAQLTNKGRRKEHRLGKNLRDMYNSFLGHTYTLDILDPSTTNYNRTKMSLQLVLASLFPPVGIQQWEDDLVWQPIPYNVYGLTDMVLIDVLQYCPRYQKLYNDYVHSAEGKRANRRFYELRSYLEGKSGLEMPTPYRAYGLYLGLKMQKEWGLELQPWAEGILPELRKMAMEQYYSSTATPEMRRFAGGNLIQKIIDDSKAKIEGKLNPIGRKLFLYSAHDTTVLYALRGTKVYYPHTVPYGAYFIMELHLKNGQYGFIIRYQDYSDDTPKILTVPGCTEFCPIDKFINLVSDNLPTKDTTCKVRSSSNVLFPFV